MKRSILVLLLGFAISASAQTPVRYSISFPNAMHHEAEVTVAFSDVQENKIELRMSRTSPGRYALHEFSKNVYNVRVVDGKGRPLGFTRPNPHQWDVAGHDGTVKVSYTIFGDLCDGTYLAIDETHAHLNMPATFMWARGFENRPIEIHFLPLDPGWKVATQLPPGNAPNTFTSPDLQFFMDSPTEISEFALREWQIKGIKPQTIRLIVHYDGTDEEFDAYAKMTRAVVDEQVELFGEPPQFDYGTYTFIADYLPYVDGDGMEHRNSTILTSADSLRSKSVDLLADLSHEFFHCWNVERIRPRSLEPFDFEHANMSGELWFAEGFTSYYDKLILIRAGITTIDEYARRITKSLNYVLNSPGSHSRSVVEMSQYAPFVDAGRSIDPKNLGNTFISYYDFGAAIALGLDLTLRNQFPEVTLDDYMRAAWRKFGKTEIPYTNDDLQRLLADLVGDEPFAQAFFARHIFGRQLLDYETLLASGGLVLRKARKDEAWLGAAKLDFEDSGVTLASGTRIGSPFYQAGLDEGDTIVTIDGDSLRSEDELQAWLDAHKPGDRVAIFSLTRGMEKTKELTVQEDPELEVVPFEHAAKTVTAEIEAFREQWLGFPPAKEPDGLVRYCPECHRAFPFRFEYCEYDGALLGITQGGHEEAARDR